jgi:hypothetical protein
MKLRRREGMPFYKRKDKFASEIEKFMNKNKKWKKKKEEEKEED